jgi:putrescine transport system substrate-binding protein
MDMKTLTPRFRGIVVAMALAVSGLAGVVGSVAAAEPPVLNIYNWADYIAEDTIANFQKETGIKVNYDNFDSNEALHAKLMAGMSGYDLVVPGSHFAKLQIQGGLLMKLDKSKIPNLKNLDPAIQAQLAKVDPGNEHLVDWLWGYTTVGINVDKVKKAIGGELPANVWDLIFKPEYVSKLRSCGVSVLDSADEVVPAALHYLGKPRVSKSPADYNAALALLKSIRPHVTLFSSSGYINDMASGSICLALGWSGDINIARQRAIDNKTGQNIQALVPANGGLLFFDVMAIPADAPNVENAYKFIDYILRPQVNAGLTNKVFYPNGTYAASKPYINPAVANNSSVFLSAADMGKMVGFADQQLTNEIRRNQNRVYTAFKTGM